MLALETKQSGGKLLPHSDLRGAGSVSRGNIAQHTRRNVGRISRRWDVGMWTGLGWPRIGTGGGSL